MLSEKSCIDFCPSGYYGNDETGKCEKCIYGCSDCDNSYECLNCYRGFLPLETGDFNITECVSNCPLSE